MIQALIVDDSATIRKVIGNILKTFNIQIQEAENGQIALKCCQAKMPDLILLDWNMPVMSGIEFLQALRNLPGGKDPKVVLCTTENNFSHIAQAMAAGADEYIRNRSMKISLKKNLRWSEYCNGLCSL